MIDPLLVSLAFRNRIKSVVVATTGLVTLAATATGYSRAAGSFVVDGFFPGMEVVPVGFTRTAVGIVSEVTPTDLTLLGGATIEAAAANRTIVAGLPVARAWGNLSFQPSGAPYVRGVLLPGGAARLRTGPFTGGDVTEAGQYLLDWFGLANYGDAAILRSITAVRALFTPGTTFLAGTDIVRIQPEIGPQIGQVTPRDDGYAVSRLSISWSADTINAVAP